MKKEKNKEKDSKKSVIYPPHFVKVIYLKKKLKKIQMMVILK